MIHIIAVFDSYSSVSESTFLPPLIRLSAASDLASLTFLILYPLPSIFIFSAVSDSVPCRLLLGSLPSPIISHPSGYRPVPSCPSD